MKKYYWLYFLIATMFLSNIYAVDKDLKGFKVKRFPFYIYSDASYKLNHFHLGNMLGDFHHLKISKNCKNNPFSGKTCIEIHYVPIEKNSTGWAQISFLSNPKTHWNSVLGGYDLTTAKRLFFYVRGKKGNEVIEFKMVTINGLNSGNPKLTTGAIKLSKNWQLCKINLTGSQLKDIAGGLAVYFSGKLNHGGCSIYIDEIYYSDKEKPANISSIKFNNIIQKY